MRYYKIKSLSSQTGFFQNKQNYSIMILQFPLLLSSK
jgi:hypothetical protein